MIFMELIEWLILIIASPLAFWCLVKWFEISDNMVKRLEKRIDDKFDKERDRI